MWKEVIVAYFKVLFCNLPGGTEEKTTNLKSGLPVSGWRYELRTFKI
jgi:hypothetical protein